MQRMSHAQSKTMMALAALAAGPMLMNNPESIFMRVNPFKVDTFTSRNGGRRGAGMAAHRAAVKLRRVKANRARR